MKDYDMLAARFAEIPDMAVSEETLGAYIEGNLSPDEMDEVREILDSDPMLAEMAADIQMDDDYHYDNNYVDVYDQSADTGDYVDYEEGYIDGEDSTESDDAYADWHEDIGDTADDYLDTDSYDDCY